MYISPVSFETGCLTRWSSSAASCAKDNQLIFPGRQTKTLNLATSVWNNFSDFMKHACLLSVTDDFTFNLPDLFTVEKKWSLWSRRFVLKDALNQQQSKSDEEGTMLARRDFTPKATLSLCQYIQYSTSYWNPGHAETVLPEPSIVVTIFNLQYNQLYLHSKALEMWLGNYNAVP